MSGWTWVKNADDEYMCLDGGDVGEAVIWSPMAHVIGISDEHARLIAAAPDLAEALEIALSAMSVHFVTNDHPAIQAARAALAKAGGDE